MEESYLPLIGLLAKSAVQGAGTEDDSALVTTGIIQELNVAGRRARITIRGGDVWLPAVAARYKVGSPAAVLLDPAASRPVRILGPVVSRGPMALATVVSGPTGGNLTVSFEGTTFTLPSPTGAFTVGASAWLLLDDWGVPVYVLGPSSASAPGANTGSGAGGSNVVTAAATIGPQSTGTYRSSTGRWDTWGGSTGWGLTDIYQGNGYGSGALIGLAAYGDQVVNLGAIAIQKITLNARRNSSGSGGALTVQGAPHGSRPGGAPSPAGSTATAGSVGSGQWTSVDLPSNVCEAFRTGAAKSLAAVGGAYAGFGGTATPGSFALTIQYTRNA